MEANKILSADILDIIFDGKNKDYGAYELRKTYNRRITRALVITGSVALLALLASVLSSTLSDKGDSKVKMNEMTIQDIKQEEKKEPPPPPPPPPPKQEPPKVEMKQFTPPVIKKDEEVEKPPPPQEELKEAKIDVVNVEGVKDQGIVAPVEIDQGKQIVEVKKEEDENKIFDKVEIEASFPGGDSKWRQYLERNANGQVATDNGAPEGTYTTLVQFVVDKEGNISDVRALTNHGYGMEEEAIRVIKKGPKWTPAVQNGRQVKAYRKQPITFRVESE
ncbi:MAG: energy transducer TonB [Chitinophagaceae bacterium]|nr:energy transducer TonB [Chitinophagaceae bacterium]MBK9383021.1 energy transducer TonB [Chitinophagaceae bacterium]MBL0305728.1 energy transducer TonB [Chitinophagaceae bacterium]HQV61272.1 energy transducer TonB [Chitinophagaceae bacterium]HQV84885.1 energy transducer TonB [Chitinophagaceae bacterium]